MTIPLLRPAPSPLAGSLWRCLAIATFWVAVVGSLTWIFFGAGDGAGREPFDALGFGGPLGIAGATSAALAFAIGGRRRWAVEVLVTVSALIAVAALVAYVVLWAYPGPVRARLGLWPFRSLQTLTSSFGYNLPRFFAPLAIPVGVVAGGVAGLLALLARRRPGAAMAAMVGLLLACSVGPVQESCTGLVVWWGWKIRWRITSMGLTSEQISASGALTGALAGVLLAGMALRLAGRTASPGPQSRSGGH